MKKYIPDTTDYFSPEEERLNVITHGLGLILSLFGMVLLIMKGMHEQKLLNTLSFYIFGLSLILLYAASSIYHHSKSPERRRKLRILDHASIYILIAGTYTPFTLVTLSQSNGWIIFGICWSIALVGVVLKIFFTGRYDLISTIMYLLMGWLIIFDIKQLYLTIPFNGFLWLMAGGIFYTVGAILYSFDHIRYNHAIFHVFVLLGSLCHFMSVYLYVHSV